MNEVVSSNIKQILITFDNFVAIYENQEWIINKNISSEEIKNAFKLAFFIEKTVTNFQSKNCLKEFLITLECWWKAKNRTLNYNENFYKVACDHLLKNFFKRKSINENILDIAIRMYTSLLQKNRLQNVLSDLIITSSSLGAIQNFAGCSKNDVDWSNLKYELILDDWSRELNCGKIEKVQAAIADMLISYKVKNNLPILINIMSLNNLTNSENYVVNLILKIVLEKMLDRSILSKIFWLTLFQDINKVIISKACINHKGFLSSFCNFFIYIGSMMEKQIIQSEIRWISDANISLCPEITYQDMIEVIECLCKCDINVKLYVLERINEAKNFCDSLIWEEVIDFL